MKRGWCAHPTVSTVVLLKKGRGGGDPTPENKKCSFRVSKMFTFIAGAAGNTKNKAKSRECLLGEGAQSVFKDIFFSRTARWCNILSMYH